MFLHTPPFFALLNAILLHREVYPSFISAASQSVTLAATVEKNQVCCKDGVKEVGLK